jgi:hypothetical protein
MAYSQFDIPFQTVALVANTALYVAGLKAATNVVALVTEVAYSFDGATSSNAPVVTEWDYSTWATNAPATNSTSVTPVKRDAARAETLQTTAAKNWTQTPTVLTLSWTVDVGAYNGMYRCRAAA